MRHGGECERGMLTRPPFEVNPDREAFPSVRMNDRTAGESGNATVVLRITHGQVFASEKLPMTSASMPEQK